MPSGCAISAALDRGRYRAFGMVLIGPRKYLEGHCHALADSETVGSSELLTIDVEHRVDDDHAGWETLLTHDADKAASAGHRFLRVMKNQTGARRYQIIDGLSVEADPHNRRLRVCAPATMHHDSLGSFITGTAMLCYFKARQRLCLHAAVVARDQHSVMICGESGAGKSSFSAALQQHGWDIVVEDLAVVESADDGYVVRPGYGRLRLWSDSVDGLKLSAQTSRIVVGADKYYLPLDSRSHTSPALTALAFLGPRVDAPVAGLRIESIAAGAASMAKLYRNSLAAYLNPPQEVAGLLSQCAGLLNQCQLYEMSLANDWSRLPAACVEFADRLQSSLPN